MNSNPVLVLFFPRTYLHIHDILKINMKLINLSKASSLRNFVLLIMERKQRKKKKEVTPIYTEDNSSIPGFCSILVNL